MASLGLSDSMHLGADTSFDTFIDSDLILDPSSPAPPTPTKEHAKDTKSHISSRITPLSSLHTRIASDLDRQGQQSPSQGVMHEFLNYAPTTESTVTTPTTSNSSSLHNLSFDFLDNGESNNPGSTTANTLSPHDEINATNIEHAMAGGPRDSASMSSALTDAVFSFNSIGAQPLMSMHSTHQPSRSLSSHGPFNRTVDDINHQPGHHHPSHQLSQHHRSLSLRDVAPIPAANQHTFGEGSLASLPFPSVKMEPEVSSQCPDPITSPSTEDRGSPTSSAVSSSIFDQGSPRHEKKRRLTSPGSVTARVNGTKQANSTNSTTSKGQRRRRSRASTASKVHQQGHVGGNFTDGALQQKDSRPLMGDPTSDIPIPAASLSVPTSLPTVHDSALLQNSISGQSSGTDSFQHEEEIKGASRNGNKRPPPSASQITESGMPFPVIDTSAKHSSLFVPPDTSGLTKREARLVKNRAAAFLSRQRKREQFEELEIKCKSLCRLVWKMWEVGTASAVGGAALEAPMAAQSRFHSSIIQDESPDMVEVFDTVLALRGGSVAPTEDGQLQGAVAAGIKSANGKIIKTDGPSPVNIPSSAAQAAHESARELIKLRAELEESNKREAALQAQLDQERSSRINCDLDGPKQQAFKAGNHDLSLTVPATFDDADEDDARMSDADSPQEDNKRRGRGSGNMKPSRTSERIRGHQPQQSQNTASHPVGQKKAAGAALMMVLFSFALFGLPAAQVGGVSHAPGSVEDLSLGRVIGAPITGAQAQMEEEEDILDQDASPSSHLSAKDLLPPVPDMNDIFSFENEDNDDKKNLTHALHGVFGGRRDLESNTIDYKAFAEDLSSSLDLDMQQGFFVFGPGSEGAPREMSKNDNKDVEDSSGAQRPDPPTKLTLFVPAPGLTNADASSHSDEDRFYDAPLATVAEAMTDAEIRKESDEATTQESSRPERELSQLEATRAALQVLRNHRLAREAAVAASKRFNKRPAPSGRVSSPPSGEGAVQEDPATFKKEDVRDKSAKPFEPLGEQTLDEARRIFEAASKASDKIRSTDFYQLEFSLSGAKVRNVDELARLFGVMRSKT